MRGTFAASPSANRRTPIVSATSSPSRMAACRATISITSRVRLRRPGPVWPNLKQPKNHTDAKNGKHYYIDRRETALSFPQCVFRGPLGCTSTRRAHPAHLDNFRMPSTAWSGHVGKRWATTEDQSPRTQPRLQGTMTLLTRLSAYANISMYSAHQKTHVARKFPFQRQVVRVWRPGRYWLCIVRGATQAK